MLCMSAIKVPGLKLRKKVSSRRNNKVLFVKHLMAGGNNSVLHFISNEGFIIFELCYLVVVVKYSIKRKWAGGCWLSKKEAIK